MFPGLQTDVQEAILNIILLVVVYLLSWVSHLQISAENWLFLSRQSKKQLSSPFNFQAWDSSESTGVYLASRRGTGTVLSIAGKDLGTLVDQWISYSLHWATQDSTICCTERGKRWTAVKWLLMNSKTPTLLPQRKSKHLFFMEDFIPPASNL